MKNPSIIFEDEQMVVLDKPAGLMVHPDGRHTEPTLEDWLKEKYPAQAGDVPGFYLVHRLDAGTSGVIAVARTERAFEYIKAQFKNRETRKTYRAFLHGALKEDRGMIDKPIGSARGGLGPRSAKHPYGTQRDALTIYRVITRGSASVPVSYVEVFPKTGRTHQIRVHFASIGHPVLCDPLYGPGRPILLGFKRLALHAFSLTLKHPNGKEMTFEAPLPPDFLTAEGELRK
jgi:23S rRNA pseudouridine1911/1915/1917 synthase